MRIFILKMYIVSLCICMLTPGYSLLAKSCY